MAFDLLTAAIGALAGSGKDEQTTTAKSDPWGPAQPYMLRNLQDTEKLGNYYKQNPFNPQQIEGYSNLFGDNQNFRQNIAPGLMNFANRGMGSNYQRQRVARPGGVAGYGGSNPAQQQMQAPQGVSGGLLGPFSVGGGQAAPTGGLLDLNGAQNPFAGGGVEVNPQTVNEEMIDQLKQELGLGNSPGNDAGDNQYGGGGGANFEGLPDLTGLLASASPLTAKAFNAFAAWTREQAAKQAQARMDAIAADARANMNGDGKGFGGGYGGEGMQQAGGYGTGDNGFGPQ